MKRDYTDAEFTVVGEPTRHPPFNGVGLPPDFHEWNLLGRLVYLTLYGGSVFGLAMLGRWAYAALMGH